MSERALWKKIWEVEWVRIRRKGLHRMLSMTSINPGKQACALRQLRYSSRCRVRVSSMRSKLMPFKAAVLVSLHVIGVTTSPKNYKTNLQNVA
jgi:hypothetical protein